MLTKMLTKMLMKIVSVMGEISNNKLLLNTVQELCYCSLLGGVQVWWMSAKKTVSGEVCQWCRLQTVDAQQIRWENHDWRFTFSNVESYCKMPLGRGYRRNVASVLGFGGQDIASMQLGGGSFPVWWLWWVSSTYRMDSTQRFRGMLNGYCVATAPVRKEQWYRMDITYFGVGPPSFWRGRMWGR